MVGVFKHCSYSSLRHLMSKPINIVYYHDALIPEHSKNVFEVLIKRLICTSPKGSKVTILCQEFHCDPQLQRDNSNTNFIFLSASFKFKLWALIIKQFLQIFSKKNNEIIIIINMVNIYTVWIWSVLTRVSGGYSICRLAGLKPLKNRDFMKKFLRSILIYLSFTLSNQIISVSEALGSFANGIVSIGKVSVISQGVASVFLNKNNNVQNLVEDSSYIFVGRLVKSKGVIQLVEAFLQLSDKPRTLQIVGDGPQYVEIERMIQGHAGITLCGSKNQLEVAQIMLSSSAIILPSDHEGTPNVLLEAMASHTLVLATNVGENGKLVGSDRGLLLRSNSVGDIKKGILASETITNRRTFVKRAHNYISKYYTEATARRRMEDTIKILLERDHI